MTTRTDILQIKFTTDGEGRVRVSLGGVAQDIGNVNKQADLTAATMSRLGGVMTGVFGVETLRRVVVTADTMANIAAKISLVSKSEEEAIATQAALLAVSQRTSTALESTVTLYSRIANAMRDNGASTAETIGLVETINKAFAVSGATAGETSAAVLQLSQALGAGALRGEEFNSVNEAAPRLMQALADSLGVTRGALRGMAEDGLLTAEVIREAFSGEQAARIAEEYSQLPDTVGRAFERLKNSSMSTIGVLNEATGATGRLAQTIGILANWIDEIPLKLGTAEGAWTRFRNTIEGQSGVGMISPLAGLFEFGLDGAEEAQNAVDAVKASLEQERLATEAVEQAFAQLGTTAPAAQAKISDAVQKQIDKIAEQAATYGLSRSAVLEYQKAQLLSVTTGEEARAGITAQYDILIKKVKAEEAATAATAASAAANKAATAAAKERAKAESEAADAIERMAEQFDSDWDAAGETEAFEQSLDQLIGTLDPATAALQRYADQLVLLQAAQAAGNLDAAGFDQYVRLLSARLQKELAATEKGVDDQVKVYQDVLVPGVQEASGLITHWLVNGFDNARDDALNLIDGLIGDITQRFLEQQLSMTVAVDAQGNRTQSFNTSFSTTDGTNNGFAGSSAQGWAGVVGQAIVAYTRPEAGEGQVLDESGAETGEMIGAVIGSFIPVIGTILGAVIGRLIGGLFDKDPQILVGGDNPGWRVEAEGESRLGRVAVNTNGLKEPTDQAFVDAIVEFDNLVATMLKPEELETARAAMAAFALKLKDGEVTIENVVSARADAIIAAVEPMYAAYLSGIDDVEERLKAFSVIRELEEFVDDIDQVIASIDPDPIVRLRTEMHNLDRAVEDSIGALNAAIASEDFESIAAAANASQQAIIRRYQAEIDMVNQIAAAMQALEQQGRAFALNMAQRIAGVGGPDNVLAVTASALAQVRGNVLNARDTEQALQHLDEFVATVDQWLQASRAAVQQWHQEQSALLAQRMTTLDDEYNAIVEAATARATAEAQYAQAVQAAQQAQIAAERARLEGMLRIAQQWVGVLEDAQGLIDELVRSSDNPQSAAARLQIYNTDLERLQAQLSSAPESERAGIAEQITTLLRERLDLAQGLYDRPSNEYTEIYNDTLRQTGRIRDIAAGPAGMVDDLQAQLDAMQSTTDAVTSFATQSASYSEAELARLEEIDAERAAIVEAQRLLDEEGNRRLAAIDEEARAYYLWAQTQGEALLAQRHQEMTDRLDALTGGLSIQEFSAQQQLRAADALEGMRDTLADFLDFIASNLGNGVPREGGGIGQPIGPFTRPRSGGGDTGDAVGGVTLQLGAITITAEDAAGGRRAAEAFIQTLDENLPAIASKLKPLMRVA